jgi:hypothetical protein
MMRRISAILMCFFSISLLTCAHANSIENFASCGNALPTDHPGFCASFKAAAVCYCINSGLPSIMCQDMNMLYARLESVFGSIQKACEYQKYTSPQDCMDNWNCYRHGKKDSRGRICSSTGLTC